MFLAIAYVLFVLVLGIFVVFMYIAQKDQDDKIQLKQDEIEEYLKCLNKQ